MTAHKKLSRREALKLMGAAAGAALLANLPSKWSKPQLTRGVLPAHAQTSLVCNDWALTVTVLSANQEADPHLYLIAGTGPDENTFPNGENSYARWACGTGCSQPFVSIDGLSQTASAQINVSSFTGVSQTVNLNFLTDPTLPILVNLETGEFSTDPQIPVNGCVWTAP